MVFYFIHIDETKISIVFSIGAMDCHKFKASFDKNVENFRSNFDFHILIQYLQMLTHALHIAL